MGTNQPPGNSPPSPPSPGQEYPLSQPEPTHYGPPPPRQPWWRQRKRLAAFAAAILLVVAAVVIGVLAISGPGILTARGTEAVCSADYDPLNPAGTSAADEYPDITDGGQVTVIDSANHVIGTGTLSLAGGSTPAEAHYTFSVRVPSGEARYGIEIGHNRGTVWTSEKEMRSGPGVSLGC